MKGDTCENEAVDAWTQTRAGWTLTRSCPVLSLTELVRKAEAWDEHQQAALPPPACGCQDKGGVPWAFWPLQQTLGRGEEGLALLSRKHCLVEGR